MGRPREESNEMKDHRETCVVVTLGNASDSAKGTVYSVKLPEGSFRKIVLKPNWVRHEEDPAFPVEALVTSSSLIEVVIDACLENYPMVEEITVGDVPLQSCDWQRLIKQAGIERLMEKYGGYAKPRIRFLDLRREYAESSGGYLRKVPSPSGGDPKGYREVVLDDTSFLDPISGDGSDFRVSDYSPEQTTSSHRRGFHRYLIVGSALDCDLFINLAKMKTHQKSGITGALKNLVGINGEKAYLVHYRRAHRGKANDEFPPGIPSAIVLQTRVREALQGRSRILFSLMRPGWHVLRRFAGIATRGTRENLRRSNDKFFNSAGSWYGNDSVWRMVYDLNRIIRYAPREGGHLASEPQREYFAIVEGIVAGEGNGPLQPLPVSLGVLLAGDDPFIVDTVMAQIMGFAYQQVPLLRNAGLFGAGDWGGFDPSLVEVVFDGRRISGIENLPVLHSFLPPPGWKHHVELRATEVLP